MAGEGPYDLSVILLPFNCYLIFQTNIIFESSFSTLSDVVGLKYIVAGIIQWLQSSSIL